MTTVEWKGGLRPVVLAEKEGGGSPAALSFPKQEEIL